MTKVNRGRKVSEAEFRRLWGDLSLSEAQIGQMLGISQTAVSSRAMTRGLPRRPASGGAIVITDNTLFRRLLLAGLRYADIAERMGCNEKTVRNHRKRLGLPGRGEGKRATMTLADFDALQLRNALAARAREEQAALRNAEMVDGRQDARWPKGRAA